MTNKKIDTQTDAQQDNEALISSRQLLLHEIAHKLEQARTAKRLSIEKPVRKLKISANHLQALESGYWDNLPDDVYVIGFLRQYSKYLDIDLSNEIKRLKNDDYTLTRPLTFPDPPVAPSRLWAWLTGGAFVVLFIAFNVISSDDDQQEIVQTDSTQYDQSVQDNTLTDNQKVTAVVAKVKDVPSTLTHNNAAEHKAVVKAANKPLAVNHKAATAKPVIAQPAPVIKTAVIINKAKTTTKRITQAKQLSNASIHVFRFEAVTDPVWMQVFLPNEAGDGKGRLLKEMLLKKGHFSNIRYATETLWITCGNALALRIKVDRKTVIATGTLGDGKKVLRDYRFDINAQ